MKLFYVTRPTGRPVPVVANLPHSGQYVPPAIRWQFRRETQRFLYGTDWHLPELYDFLPELGVTVIRATHSRYVVDLNRNLEEPIFGHHRSAVIYHKTPAEKQLYEREPSRRELDDRILRYYLPYHRELEGLLADTVRDHGRAVLIDLHSYGISPPQADVVLGDVNGTTCPPELIGAFHRAFLARGFSVARNDKWVGGHITRRYGVMENVAALQIEHRYSTYLDTGFENWWEAPARDSAAFRSAGERFREIWADALDELFPGRA